MNPPNGQFVNSSASAATEQASAGVILGEELMISQVAEVWALLDARIRDMDGASDALRVDCAPLREIDGAGLQLLLVAARHLESLGARLSLVGLNGKLHEQLSSLDPSGLFHLQTLEAA
mgnify:CR=1 FL=1